MDGSVDYLMYLVHMSALVVVWMDGDAVADIETCLYLLFPQITSELENRYEHKLANQLDR